MSDILSTIDDTLTYYSSGLGEEIEVPFERDELRDLTYEVLGEVMQRWADSVMPAVRDAVDELGKMLAQLAPPLLECLEFAQTVETARRVRLRRMHTAYRHRRRKW